ncbi:MAG: hypothetical protein MZV63_23350 [Marinilabiliales bacterium]|nr:hypothetical protein [Marinilabiliales bacterium]
MVNDYRQGDNAAYLYHTKDLGQELAAASLMTRMYGVMFSVSFRIRLSRGLMFAGTEYRSLCII